MVAAKPEPPPTLSTAPRSRASAKTESSDGEDWRDEEEAVNGEQTRAATGWSCPPCQTHYADRELFIAHMAQQHGKVRLLAHKTPHSPHTGVSYFLVADM